MDSTKIKELNSLVLHRLSLYLNNCPDRITAKEVEDAAAYCKTSKEEAFRILIAGSLDLYGEKELYNLYLRKMFKRLDVSVYRNDPYYKNVKIEGIRIGDRHTGTKTYKPYELFVYNDLLRLPDGRILPQVGYFEEEFSYPVIYQNNREWMLITPNEIETMKNPVAEAHGKVLTYGLGLGYYAYMVSEKPEVESVTVIECDDDAINLFKHHILPQFPNATKIKIIKCDAFKFALSDKATAYDCVFADIWHDPSDGLEPYVFLKALEKPGVRYSYWIENTLKCYLKP